MGLGGVGSLGSLNLGTFAAGTGLIFRYAVDGGSYDVTATFFKTATGFDLQYAELDKGNVNRLGVNISGVSTIENGGCSGAAVLGGRVIPCTGATDVVTATPEPGSIALFATGLAGLVPVVIRRRRRAA